MTINKKVQDLKKGDRVAFYGQTFIITESAKLVCNTQSNYRTYKEEPLPKEDWVYVAKGEIENRNIAKNEVNNILLNYNHFQGNSRAKYAVYENQIHTK